jgi:hypothetical protein
MSIMKTAHSIKVKDKPMFKGFYTIRQYEKGQIKYDLLLVKHNDGRYSCRFIVDKDSVKRSTPCYEAFVNNKIVASAGYGVNLLLRQMAGDTAYPILIDGVDFGTGTNAPSASDTALQTPTVTNISPADRTVTSATQLVVDVFVPSGVMPNATYREIGLKMNGRLFARSSLNYTKTTNKDTTIEYTIEANVA